MATEETRFSRIPVSDPESRTKRANRRAPPARSRRRQTSLISSTPPSHLTHGRIAGESPSRPILYHLTFSSSPRARRSSIVQSSTRNRPSPPGLTAVATAGRPCLWYPLSKFISLISLFTLMESEKFEMIYENLKLSRFRFKLNLISVSGWTGQMPKLNMNLNMILWSHGWIIWIWFWKTDFELCLVLDAVYRVFMLIVVHCSHIICVNSICCCKHDWSFFCMKFKSWLEFQNCFVWSRAEIKWADGWKDRFLSTPFRIHANRLVMSFQLFIFKDYELIEERKTFFKRFCSECTCIYFF